MLAAGCVQMPSCWLQINISLAGTSKMLFNTEKLSGMPRKIKELAKREAQVSLHQQVGQHVPWQGCPPLVVVDPRSSRRAWLSKEGMPSWPS